MMKIGAIIDQLFVAARDLDSGGKARLVSSIYRRNKLMAMGENSYKRTHPFQLRYGCNDESCFWHAETRAIHNAISNGIDLGGCDLYVARARKANKKWEYGIAKPCNGCMRAIRDYGLRRAIFSLNGEGYGIIEI